MRWLTVLCLMLLALPATAKGPELVAIETSDGEVISVDLKLPYRDEHRELMIALLEASRIWYGGGEALATVPKPLGPLTELVWVNGGPPHKTVEERTIRQELYLHAPGGPIINTPPQASTEGWGSSVLGWARVDASIGAIISEIVESAEPEADSSGLPLLPVAVTTAVLVVLVARGRSPANYD